MCFNHTASPTVLCVPFLRQDYHSNVRFQFEKVILLPFGASEPYFPSRILLITGGQHCLLRQALPLSISGSKLVAALFHNKPNVDFRAT